MNSFSEVSGNWTGHLSRGERIGTKIETVQFCAQCYAGPFHCIYLTLQSWLLKVLRRDESYICLLYCPLLVDVARRILSNSFYLLHNYRAFQIVRLVSSPACVVQPLGMESRAIPDSKISASSEWNSNHGPTNARLNFQAANGKTGAWSAEYNDVNQWLGVDFGRPLWVTQIQTQGRQGCSCEQWVKTYALSYRHDNIDWQTYMHNGQQQVTRLHL